MFHYSYYLKKQKIIKESKGITKIGFDIEMLKKQIKLALPMGSQEMMIAVGYSFFYKIMSIIGILS
jgi:Na+-driven multidrug efflux pump